NQGGFFMYPIMGVSIVGLTIIAERAYHLFIELSMNMTHFSRRIYSAVEAGDVNGAIQECHKYFSHPLAQVLNAALLKANRGDKEIERAIQGKYLQVAPVVQKRLGYLSMAANISTLMGLLGTIIGLIQCFQGVALADAAAKQEVLSKGISVAMFTTAAGLVVAIPCLIGFHVLTNRQNRILDVIQESATELLNLISASNRDLRAGPKRVSNNPFN
ncbi:MAG: MotA/TolQ/ExbB proton channel family protein, partial [Bdellovibrionales bacterium]|nr:MotA/TolQ/ExbB proton channel family protein [Bdellovibrionales bacterium]